MSNSAAVLVNGKKEVEGTLRKQRVRTRLDLGFLGFAVDKLDQLSLFGLREFIEVFTHFRAWVVHGYHEFGKREVRRC